MLKYSDWVKSLPRKSVNVSIGTDLLAKVGVQLGMKVAKPIDDVDHFKMVTADGEDFSVWCLRHMKVYFSTMEEEAGLREVPAVWYRYSTHSHRWVESGWANKFWDAVREEAKKLLPDGGASNFWAYPEKVVTLPIPGWLGVAAVGDDPYQPVDFTNDRMFLSEAKESAEKFAGELRKLGFLE